MSPRLWMCEGKSRLTKAVARDVARRMNQADKGVSPFRCWFCKHWHVGAKLAGAKPR